MEKDKFVHIDPNSNPVKPGSEQDQMETAEANMKIQDAFYDENESNSVDPANLNNQTAILTEMD